jgi:hypothetical protein
VADGGDQALDAPVVEAGDSVAEVYGMLLAESIRRRRSPLEAALF